MSVINPRHLKRGMLIATGWFWLAIPAWWLLAYVEGVPNFVLGAMGGLLLVATEVFGPITSVVAIWGSIRERGNGYLLIAALALPPTVFVWWQLFFGSIPGTAFQ